MRRTCSYSMSWNSARWRLYPVVRMLAMLLAMTWTLSSWAIIPVAAVCSARMVCFPDAQVASARNFGELLDGILVKIALLLEEQADLAIGAGDLDQPGHLDDAVDVRFLGRALDQAGLGVRHGGDAGRGQEVVGAVLLQLLGRIEAHQAQLSALRFGLRVAALGHGHHAVGRDRDIAVGRLQDDRSALAHHLRSVGGDELTLRVDLHRAVAGVSFAGGSLHDQESLAVDRDVEWVAGRLHGASTEVVPGPAIVDEAHLTVGRLEPVFACDRHQELLEHRIVRLEAGGVQVRDVVRDDVELAPENHLPR